MSDDLIDRAELRNRCDVADDLVGHWETLPGFPAARDGLWGWETVLRWLRDTKRAPTMFRFRTEDGLIFVEMLDRDGGRWHVMASFGEQAGSAEAYPAIQDLLGLTEQEAREWADRQRTAWEENNLAWMQDHPGEYLPRWRAYSGPFAPRSVDQDPPLHLRDEPPPTVVSLSQAAAILGLSKDAAAKALQRADVSSGYPAAEVRQLALTHRRRAPRA